MPRRTLLHGPPGPSLRLSLAVVILPMSAARAAAPVPECITAASRSFQSGDFKAVIDQAERCARTGWHPRAHYLAAMAHRALEQDALAVLALRRYLAGDLRDELPRTIAVAKARLAEAQARLIAVTLRLSPAIAAGEQLEVTAERRVGDTVTSLLIVQSSELERHAGELLLQLDAGTWSVTVVRSGHPPVQGSLELVAGGGPQVLSLAPAEVSTAPAQPEVAAPVVPAPAPEREPAPRPASAPTFPRKLWLGSSVTAGGLLVVGGTIPLGLGVRAMSRAGATAPGMCTPGPALASCREAMAAGATLRSAGAGLIGAGVGALASGLTGLAPNPRQRRSAWLVEAAVGGAVTAVGVTMLGLMTPAFNAVNTGNDDPSLHWGDEYTREVVGLSHLHATGAGLTGAGIGLALGAVTGLVVQRRAGRGVTRRARLEPSLGLRLRF